MKSSYPWKISTICSSSLASPGRSSRTSAWPRNQWVQGTLPSASWKSWMLNMTMQTFQALSRTIAHTWAHHIATCYLHCSSNLKSSLMACSGIGSYRPPVSFGLKEGAKPYHGRPFPIPKIHKATLMREINCLLSIGVLKWQPSLQWASPSFIILKKDHIVCTIPDFRELNKHIVRKPYPIPKSSTTL